MTIKIACLNSYSMATVLHALSDTISKISAVLHALSDTISKISAVLHALSDTISKISAVEIVHDQLIMTLTHEWIYVKCKYINRTPILDFLFDCSCNVCHISHHFQAICRQNVYATPYPLELATVKCKLPYDNRYSTCYLMVIVILSPSVIISKIFTVKMCMTLTFTLRMGQGQM